MPILYATLLTLFLVFLPSVGVGLLNLKPLFGVFIPYAALFIFIFGLIYRVVKWASSPVPFCIPTVCGQAKSLSWIRNDRINSPHTIWGIVVRMALEVVLFRSLMRNEKARFFQGGRLLFYGNMFLWLGGLIFHWSLFIIIVRHLRLFLEPVPSFILFIQSLDGFFEVGTPAIFFTDTLIILAIIYLFFRRVFEPQLRYFSISADYFPLMLIFAIVVTGLMTRHLYKIDMMEVKSFLTALCAFKPHIPKAINTIFFIHIFLVSILLIYIPFSKLTHMAGLFFSPTRNLKNLSRMERHINPWDYPVRVHTYEEWENEFRDAMKDAGLSLDKEGLKEIEEGRRDFK